MTFLTTFTIFRPFTTIYRGPRTKWSITKNPAYGRQSISWPMQIVAPMPKSAKKNFFLRGDFKPLPNENIQMLDHFFPLLLPKDFESIKILDIRLWEVGAKRPLKGTSKVEKVREKKTFFCVVILDNFQTKMFISETTSFHYFSPKDSESLKILDIRLREVGAK